ncbi:MAG: AAA family ATPase [Pseudomonadota bacterium]
MSETTELDIEKSYKAILEAARNHRFISYGEVAEASGVPWNKARRLMPTVLDRLAREAHARDWPLVSAIVVNKENLEEGTLDGSALEGFLAAAERLGIEIKDPMQFVRDEQQKVFAWATNAPAELDLEDSSPGTGGGPRFLAYFNPVLEALRTLGGEATPSDVYAWIRQNHSVSQEELQGVNKNGQSKFENKVAWARFYLAKAGLIEARKRGLWTLTSEGAQTDLDDSSSLALFRQVQATFKTSDNEDEAAPEPVSAHELFDDPNRRFWFVGSIWGDDGEQTERFLNEGCWQNGHEEKFYDRVRRMKPGDRIAIKATFTKKYNLPFDNRGTPVSCMRIKATGTIVENRGDGQTVKVDWEPRESARDWFFYTYRTTVEEADPNDDHARRLILFTFAGAEQDYEYWTTKVPYFARRYGKEASSDIADFLIEAGTAEDDEEESLPTYGIENIIKEGCFFSRPVLEQALTRVQRKKNLILQGPPGTGKTWLAKKLAYALIGSKDRSVTRERLRVVQFHPSLSYEDFVRGWRPAGDGRLSLVDGVFLETLQAAAAEPDRPFVLLIEEINRGNPAQVFGEMLTLLEDSKRNAESAIELAYRREDGERIYIPQNLHVIGTMNIADRSLALVDLALRRRFAFVTLEPQLNEAWKSWCVDRCGLPEDAVAWIDGRMAALNDEIAKDRALGPQYKVGHSYVTPIEEDAVRDPANWFREVVETEIIPLLEEYWFDSQDKVQSARQKLLEGVS